MTLYRIELALLECDSRQLIRLFLELNFVVGDVLAELFKVRQILIVVIECGDHCLEELVVAETAAALGYAMRVKHGQSWQDALELLHLKLALLHARYDVICVYWPLS